MELKEEHQISKYLERLDWMNKSVWSYTKLSNYRSCPRYFKYNYIDHLEELGEFKYSEPLIKGTYIHSYLESYIQNEYNHDPNVEVEDPYCHNDEEGIDITPDKVLDWLNIVMEFLDSKEGKKLKLALKHSDDIHTEYKIQNIDNNFLGYIDLLFLSKHRLYICDWKTGSFRDYGFDQTSLYAYSFLEYYFNKYPNKKIDSVHIQYIFVEDPDYKLKIELPIDKFLDEQKYVLEDLKKTIEDIKSEPYVEGYLPNSKGWKRCDHPESSTCYWCGMKEYCLEDYKRDSANILEKVAEKIKFKHNRT